MAFSLRLLLALLLSCSLLLPTSLADETFDVRRHLSTVTRYEIAREASVVDASSSAIPDGCEPVHLNLVARHGTRSPTKKRIKELDGLAIRLEALVTDAKQILEEDVLQKIPTWLWGWQSPWKGRGKGGELISKGEVELYQLGVRIRDRFPTLFGEEYHPDTYHIRATQVPRASASAVAFGMGMFSGKGSLGPGQHRAFSIVSESRASDLHLRFYDTCETYKKYRKNKEPEVEKMKEPVIDQIVSSLISRYHLNFTNQDVKSLWFLCKQEASLLDITNQACSLFNPSEVSLLEWTDDLEVFMLKGYGESVNYRMGLPLLEDVVQSMEKTINSEKEMASGSPEKARLRFAHAETVVPFTCLLGLFLEESEFKQIQREQPLSLPPLPPSIRNWKGSMIAPFAGNNMLALYKCSGNTSKNIVSSGDQRAEYFVRVFHNEIAVPLPGCGQKDFCQFKDFKEKIVNPHLVHDFNSVCTIKMKLPESESQPQKPCSFMCKLSNLLGKGLSSFT
ncbi:multiple inositol polyphosphate phosphatase 1-like [Zingiber officinale]|uniref:multiple inositol polyphosphate phosphatase 1-like n=1 Tax=Zingiber officinale TaxID=94328 RepID=UPI001C4DA5C0|nr:multiple inositol polyphosphate phosphatase 1-like [Zingiber officinale]